MADQSVLVVEDTDEIRELVRTVLAKAGFDVRAVSSGAECLEEVRRQAPDLIVLDLGLPDADGTEVCRQIRAESECYVLMLTARAEEVDLLIGLAVGADGYMAKPFSPRELVARVGAVLRRATAASATGRSGPLEIGELRLDPDRRTVGLRGQGLDLTRREFELLELLMREAGSVVSRERLIDEVWDENWFGSTKTLDVHVAALRKKLADDPANPRYLHTARGVGFRFASPRDEA